MRGKLARVVAVWMTVLAAMAGLALRVAPAAHADAGSDEALFLSLTNSLRAGKGLQTLAPYGQLTSIARSWSAHMAAAGAISHNPSLPNQVTASWTELGENVGTGGTVAAIQDAFIASPHHYENLVNGDYNYVGIGVAYGANGAIFVTVDFMALAGSHASTPTPAPSAPRATAAPRPATTAAPRAVAARAAPAASPSPAAAASAPALAGPAPAPVPVLTPDHFRPVLEQLRTVDTAA